jgi:hypothetical protein
MQARERIGGFANGLARSPRIPQARAGLVHSSSEGGIPILADSRARLPPPPFPGAAFVSPPRQPNSRPTRSSPLRPTTADTTRTVARRSPRNGGSSTTIAPRVSPPPRPPRNPQRRLFNRMFHPSRSSDTILPPSRVPSPPSTPVTPPTSSSRASPHSRRLISETRSRLPPPLEVSPVPYRPPGQRLFPFLNR